jgi:eukaryotic-like serine/threonine-protein kinase
MSMSSGRIFEFGEFQLDVAARSLCREKAIVLLSSRAFDVLLYFVQNPGKVLTREEVLKNVWAEAFVDENSLVQSISALRRALNEKPGDNSYVVTLPGRGYQFVAQVRVVRPEIVAPENNNEDTVPEPAQSDARKLIFQRHAIQTNVVTAKEEREQLSPAISRSRVVRMIAGLALGAVLVASVAFGGVWYRRSHWVPKLTEKDTIVVADFDNRTGDSVFDDTLKQALTVGLDQSPYLNVVSDQKIGEALKLMGKDTGQRVTGGVARDLCQRVNGNALLQGSIANFGSQYLAVLTVTNCATGDLLVSEQVRAESKEKILPALDGATSRLRGKLGESLGSIEKYDTPVEQASTPSLAALQAYSAGLKAWQGKGNEAAIPFYERAIALDPNFAMAYARLGQAYANLGVQDLAAENISRALSLRGRVSERERFYIDSRYYDVVTGENEKAIQVLEQWRQLYPREAEPAHTLAWLYKFHGRFEDALREARESVRLEPVDSTYYDVVEMATMLDLVDEAQTALAALKTYDRDPKFEAVGRYLLAFLRDDTAGMQKLVTLAAGTDFEGDFLDLQSATEAYHGRLQKAREFVRRAVKLKIGGRAGALESAADLEVESALREAAFGYHEQAKHDVNAALSLSKQPSIRFRAALALALVGDAGRAETIAADLAKRYPLDTSINMYGVPSVRAAIELSRNDPARVVQELEVTSPYELGCSFADMPFFPVYIRGQAFLAMQRGREAAAEFQKYKDHPGAVMYYPLGALARLGLARAYRMQGDTTKARAAYQEFYSLWKDADPDIPILKEAKAEYAKLQ